MMMAQRTTTFTTIFAFTVDIKVTLMATTNGHSTTLRCTFLNVAAKCVEGPGTNYVCPACVANRLVGLTCLGTPTFTARLASELLRSSCHLYECWQRGSHVGIACRGLWTVITRLTYMCACLRLRPRVRRATQRVTSITLAFCPMRGASTSMCAFSALLHQ